MIRRFTLLTVMLFSCILSTNTAFGVAPAPTGFTSFTLGDHSEETQLINNFLWYHFGTRIQATQTIYPMEYLTTSDMWLSNAINPIWSGGTKIQDILRQKLLNMKMSPDGYINTHQHYSHSHEQAWPFPLWIQGYDVENKTGAVGWHFNHSGPGWMWDMFFVNDKESPFARDKALEGWKLKNVESFGIVDNKWKLKSTGKNPSVSMPNTVTIDAFNSPYMQLRWKRSTKAPASVLPYVEWKRMQDTDYNDERRVYFDFNSGNPEYESVTGTTHSMITLYSHPMWEGKIKDLRISLSPGEEGVDFEIDSFFSVYDTRQSCNNPIYIISCWDYFKWTGDIYFLKSRINQMRNALKFQQTELCGLKLNHIRNTMPGHDGIAGVIRDKDQTPSSNYGHGIGSNYWDITSFGWDDMYATNQYFKSTLVMAEVEEAILDNPQWGITPGYLAFEPKVLRKHAKKVKQVANKKFWNSKDGRFFGCIDKNGKKHDYGFTFLNLDSIWYGIASDSHAKKIMDWITGERIVKGDTSQGDDIYVWRFGPRATTIRNLEWYQFIWYKPEMFPWGGQVQDGGGVLGFTFYDLWARLQVVGADNAWQRFMEILEWEKDVWKEGGYRNFYEGGKQGTTLQGGGTAGGLGIDAEFFESSLVPSIITYGFMGIEPQANSLKISPKLPTACPEMTINNMLYRNVEMDITVSDKAIKVVVKTDPTSSLFLDFTKKYKRVGTGKSAKSFKIDKAGSYSFTCK